MRSELLNSKRGKSEQQEEDGVSKPEDDLPKAVQVNISKSG